MFRLAFCARLILYSAFLPGGESWIKALHLLVGPETSPDPPGGCTAKLLRRGGLTIVNTPKHRQQLSITALLAHTLFWSHRYKTAIVYWAWQSRELIVWLKVIVYRTKCVCCTLTVCVGRVDEVQLCVIELIQWGAFIPQLDLNSRGEINKLKLLCSCNKFIITAARVQINCGQCYIDLHCCTDYELYYKAWTVCETLGWFAVL